MIGRESRCTPAGEVQNEATPPLGSGHSGGLASGKDSINNVSWDQRTQVMSPVMRMLWRSTTTTRWIMLCKLHMLVQIQRW